MKYNYFTQSARPYAQQSNVSQPKPTLTKPVKAPLAKPVKVQPEKLAKPLSSFSKKKVVSPVEMPKTANTYLGPKGYTI